MVLSELAGDPAKMTLVVEAEVVRVVTLISPKCH